MAHCSKRISVLFLFAINVVGVMPCGGPQKSPRTSSIVQIIFSFWSFEISDGILRNQKLIIGLDSFSNQRLHYLALFGFASLHTRLTRYILQALIYDLRSIAFTTKYERHYY